MFGIGKKWRTQLLIEGTKEADLIARTEGYPDVNPDWDQFPLDIKLPEKRTFWQAVKKTIEYSKHGIYSMFYKVTKENR